MTTELLLQLIMAIGGPVAVYAGIKSDLATIHERATAAATSAARAHERIDQQLHHQQGSAMTKKKRTPPRKANGQLRKRKK